MKQVKGYFIVSNDNPKVFGENVSEDIKALQADRQEVNVQYQMSNGVYSALVLGLVDNPIVFKGSGDTE